MRFYTTLFLVIFFISCKGQSSKDTEIWEPIPSEVYSISDSSAPNDAIVLFDGTDLSKWKAKWSNKESGWQINDDGSVTVVFDGSGGIETLESFGSVNNILNGKQVKTYHTKIKVVRIVVCFYKTDMKFKSWIVINRQRMLMDKQAQYINNIYQWSMHLENLVNGNHMI